MRTEEEIKNQRIPRTRGHLCSFCVRSLKKNGKLCKWHQKGIMPKLDINSQFKSNKCSRDF